MGTDSHTPHVTTQTLFKLAVVKDPLTTELLINSLSVLTHLMLQSYLA